MNDSDNELNNQVIRGSFNSTIYHNNYDFIPFIPYSIYTNYKKQIYRNYIEEKKEIMNKLLHYETINSRIIQQINHIDKKCCLYNVKYSNTINFIINNYNLLKEHINNLVLLYNQNMYYINTLIEHINCININIENILQNKSV